MAEDSTTNFKIGAWDWVIKAEAGPAPGSRAWMAKLMSDIFNQIQAVREDGQKEYSQDEADAFSNFRRAAAKRNVPMTTVLMIFLDKHLDGINAHLAGHTSQREDVRGRIKDAICYLCLLWGMLDAQA